MFPENKLWNQKSTHCIHPLPLGMCIYMRKYVFKIVSEKKIQCLFFFFFTRHRHLSRPQADRVCLSVSLFTTRTLSHTGGGAESLFLSLCLSFALSRSLQSLCYRIYGNTIPRARQSSTAGLTKKETILSAVFRIRDILARIRIRIQLFSSQWPSRSQQFFFSRTFS